MDNIKVDAVKLVRGLADYPRFKRQAELIQRYFAPDVEFYHFYFNLGQGREDLTAIYQLGELTVVYHNLDVFKVLYDPEDDTVALHIQINVRPVTRFKTMTKMGMFVLLELEDVDPEQYRATTRVTEEGMPSGKRLKRITAQRDYFDRSPLLALQPGLGGVFAAEFFRKITARVQTLAFQILREVIDAVLPPDISHGLFGLWKAN